jgi:general stress protein YciG
MADEMTRSTPAKRGPKPGTPAAKHGGQAVREKYGSAFYSNIGKKGGNTVKADLGIDHYSRIGEKGGKATRDKLGPEHYARIGRIGGSRPRHPASADGRPVGQS